MKHVKTVLIIVVLVGLVAFGLGKWASNGSVAGANQSTPSAEFIVAAMKDQVAARGKSLEARFEYFQSGYEDEKATIHYVYTPDMLFLKQVLSGQTMVDSIDKDKQEFRRFHVTEAGGKTGLIDSEPIMGFLISQLTMDPLIRPLDDEGTLIDAVGRGSVSSSAEQVEGHLCWRVEIPAISAFVTRFLVWVDPSIGYCPRKVEIEREDQSPKVILFRDYESLGNGVWYPGEITSHFTVARRDGLPAQLVGDLVFVSKLIEAVIDKTFSKDELTTKFSSGTRVEDRISDAIYTLP